MKRSLALVLLCAVLTPSSAVADTPGCVSHGEYDNLYAGLSTSQVAGRFDTSGWYIGSSDERFRRGYETCWAPNERKVVVWYSLTTGLSVDWDVRDY